MTPLPNPFPGVSYDKLERRVLRTSPILVRAHEDDFLARIGTELSKTLEGSHDTHIDIKWVNIQDSEHNPMGNIGRFYVALTRVRADPPAPNPELSRVVFWFGRFESSTVTLPSGTEVFMQPGATYVFDLDDHDIDFLRDCPGVHIIGTSPTI